MMQPGEMAPDFTLESTQGTFALSAFRGEKHVVIIFYPKDNTPGWNRQLSAARDAAQQYAEAGAQLVAVNPGSLESHAKWSEQFGFPFPIAVDEDKKVAAAYGAVNMLGNIKRTVFVVDRQGRVAWAQEGMPETSEILAAIKA